MKVLCLALTVILSYLNRVSAADDHISGADVQQVTVDFFDNLTLTCDLKMHTDLAAQQPLNISWEAMGKDVVRYDGSLHYGPLFKHRASAKWEDGKLSFMLSPAVLSDADIYECLLDGRRSLSTVIVTVSDPYDNKDSFYHSVSDTAELPCWGKISKSRTLEKVSVHWKKDGKEFYSLIGGKDPNPPSKVYMNQDLIQEYGELTLFIENLTLEDSGIYECLYRDNNFGSEVPGIPSLVKLTVGEDIFPTVIEPFVISDNSSPSPSSYPTMAVQEQEEILPEMQGTSAPETSPGEEEETGPPLPWVRIGIISGVLIVTALVMGPLVAVGKI